MSTSQIYLVLGITSGKWSGAMMRFAFFFVFALIKVQYAQGQIKQQFPNLFRGGRRPESEGSKEPLMAIQPVPGRDARRAHGVGSRNTMQEGFITLHPEVWSQEEIEIQLFASQYDNTRFRFRQSHKRCSYQNKLKFKLTYMKS